MKLEHLQAHHIPLSGKHLIEASAGTGKTYNITRIYLRLLLERELTVEQILLMTFTKDATQELRGRIDAFIRECLNDWPSLIKKEDYFKAISERVNTEKVIFLLKRALLFLDEASIFTIHGFCKRVLTQHAFNSGLAFNAKMEADSSDLILEACQDWYRGLSKASPDEFTSIAQFWSTPSSFLSSFKKAIGHNAEITVLDSSLIEVDFIKTANQAYLSLTENENFLYSTLIEVKKGDEQEQRITELNSLKQWLLDVQHDIKLSYTRPIPDAFINGRRFGRSTSKVALKNIFAPVTAVKLLAGSLVKLINKANAFAIVQQGIYHIRSQVVAKKNQHNILDFDDLIKTLADCLIANKNELAEKPDINSLAQILLKQYPVALVDEFQDTDPQQFSILQAIYYQPPKKEITCNLINSSGLYLIGDPKQAIYGFRGCDVFAYLAARHTCDYHWLMDTNWRSTPEMVAGYNEIFKDKIVKGSTSVFGYDIPYNAVKSGKKSLETTLLCGSTEEKTQSTQENKALQFVLFRGEKNSIKQTVRPFMATWCANEIQQLLKNSSSNKVSNSIDQKLTPQNKESVKPQDIAVLVRDGTEANEIKNALQQLNLASVFLSNRANLLHSVQAKQLISLLNGLLHLENERSFTAAICCGLLGFHENELHQLQHNEIEYQQLKFDFIALRVQWQKQSFITMALHLMHNHFKVPTKDKDRCLTNLLHLFELLQSASQRFRQPQALLFWFEQQCSLDNPDIESELRLESDDDLIRIVTQHGSKGLEYPIVFIPFSSRHKDPLKFANKGIDYIEYHDDSGALCLSLGGTDAAKKAMAEEAYAESIRLLYVAITRAERRCYILVTAFDQYHNSPLGRTLKWQAEQDIHTSLQTLVTAQDQAISLIEIKLPEPNDTEVQFLVLEPTVFTQIKTKEKVDDAPKVSQFNAKIERNWWLSSFSSLSRNLRHTGVSIPDRDRNIEGISIKHKNEMYQLRFELSKGAHSGNLLHDILEHTNFCEPHWAEVTKWPLLTYGELTIGYSEANLFSWLQEILQTPLDKSVVINTKNLQQKNSIPRLSLSELPMDKTLRECEFYFPMESVKSKELANLLTAHRSNALLASGKRTQGSQFKVKLPDYQTLSGMMHGFIDLIFEYQGKYYLCDYKSNHLGNHFEHYLHDDLLSNIEQNHYDLQYLIYSLALHRYLKASLIAYDAAQHFGGVYYCYLRGMTNDKNYLNSGVYYRKITQNELDELDKLFNGKSSLGEKMYDE